MPPTTSSTAAPPFVHGTLAGRYRLVRPLAAGGSGRAYVAEDLLLRRRVAVKVLHEALSSDAGFLERFRSEARIVASLHHPHIVTVHDWGDDPVPFMVLELLTGGSLAALLRTGARLGPAQAARVGVQVASALDQAHRRGLVHRDVKPANLLFDEHGSVRVADFGLARALAEAGLTEPVDGIVGTARYAAPEQGSGATLDGRADLYALGLVLVEAVTGDVPLVGESPLATLALRASHPVEAPVEMGSLGVVVERAGLPGPVERYPDAAAFGRAIEAAAAMLPEARPLPLAGLGFDLDDAEPTEMAAAIRPATNRPSGPRLLPTTETDALAPALSESGARTGRTASRRRRVLPWVVATVTVVALAGAGLAARAAMAPVVHVPNLVGENEEGASASLGRTGLTFSVSRRVHGEDPAGTVTSQSPGAGDDLRRGGRVSVVVSAGPPPVALPAVVGKTETDAARGLRAAGFEVALERRFHASVEAERVILQEPSTRQAPRGSTVTVVVSRGPRPVVLPNTVGMATEEARTTLADAGFDVVVAEEYSDTAERGIVIRQTPVGGQDLVPGSPVTIVASKGPQTVRVPDVRGMSVEDATGALRYDGLDADVVKYEPGARVKRQDPSPGTGVRRGTVVTLFL